MCSLYEKLIFNDIEKFSGEIFNVGPKEPTSIKDVVQYTCEAMNVSFESIVEMTGDRLGQDSCY